MVRLFVAHPIPDQLEVKLQEVSKKNELVRGIRWTPGANMHITLFFIGEVEENNVTAIRESLNKLFSNQQPFSIDFDTICTAGKKKISSMIWARYIKNTEFSLLGKEISSVMKPFMTIKSQEHEHIPHITLARMKHGADLLRLNLTGGVIPLLPELNYAELWQTVQSPEGVTYKCLEKYSFGK